MVLACEWPNQCSLDGCSNLPLSPGGQCIFKETEHERLAILLDRDDDIAAFIVPWVSQSRMNQVFRAAKIQEFQQLTAATTSLLTVQPLNIRPLTGASPSSTSKQALGTAPLPAPQESHGLGGPSLTSEQFFCTAASLKSSTPKQALGAAPLLAPENTRSLCGLSSTIQQALDARLCSYCLLRQHPRY